MTFVKNKIFEIYHMSSLFYSTCMKIFLQFFFGYILIPKYYPTNVLLYFCDNEKNNQLDELICNNINSLDELMLLNVFPTT